MVPDKGYEIEAKEETKEVEYFVISKETGEEYLLHDPLESSYAQYMKYCVEKGDEIGIDGFEEWLKTH